MTPLERRDEIAAALPATFRQVSHAKFLPNDPNLITDALMPRIEEWLSEAWDDATDATFSYVNDGRLSPLTRNPYRRTTP